MANYYLGPETPDPTHLTNNISSLGVYTFMEYDVNKQAMHETHLNAFYYLIDFLKLHYCLTNT